MSHYGLRLFYRNLIKHKFLSLFNIAGLGMAMGAFLLILFYVHFEKSFDDFHQDQDRIYRLIMTRYMDGSFASKRPETYPAMTDAIKEDYPGVEAVARIMYSSSRGTGILMRFETSNGLILRDDLSALSADSEFFKVFSLNIIQGVPSSLDRPFTAMLSTELAQELYGNENPVGKVFKEDDGRDYLITGLFEAWEGNTHLDFEMIKSFESIGARHNSTMHKTSWNWDRMKTYVKLEAGVGKAEFESRVAQVVNDNRPQPEGFELDETISLQALTDIRLGSDFEERNIFNKSKSKVYGFLLIGLVILLMGWLNFVNLSIARGLDRTKEAGIKKVMGARRSHLIKQHFGEALQVNLLAFIIGLSLFQLCLPRLKSFAGIPGDFQFNAGFVLWLILALLVGSLLSGAYPAFTLSRVNVILAMKNKLSAGRGSLQRVRTLLTSVQFIISLSLLITVSIIYQQLNHLRSIDLGTRIEGVLVVKQPRQINYEQFSANPDVIKNEWKEIAGVEKVASSYAIPGSDIYAYQIKEVNQPDSRKVYIPEHTVDHEFLTLYELELLAGRNFSKEMATDDSAAIINESAMKALGFSSPDEAIGKRLTSPEDEFIRHVIGVIRDYHQLSPATPKQPVLFGLDPESRGFYSIQFNTDDLPRLQAEVKQRFDEVFPGNVYHSFFLDDYFAEQYKADNTLGALLSVFSIVAISLAAMGLVSMTYFNVIRRMKEMSIRKVLGADFGHLIRLLSASGNASFLIASFISIPAVYYLMNSWLNGYHERISLNLFDFGLPMLLLYGLAAIAMLLVMLQVVKSNPVESLRDE